jgi:hypothetical protein
VSGIFPLVQVDLDSVVVVIRVGPGDLQDRAGQVDDAVRRDGIVVAPWDARSADDERDVDVFLVP